MALVYDLADTQELQGFVRGVQQEQDTNRFILSQFLPNRNIDDIEYRITQGQLLDEDVAMIRAWDTEAPIGKRQGLTRIMGELPPISKKIRLGEEDRLRLRQLQRGGNAAEVVNAIFDDAANLARSVAGRIEQLRGEAIYSAALAINENGVNQPVSFNRSGSHSVAPGILWSSTGTAVPIQDEMAWLTTYRTTNGTDPGLALTSTAVLNNLLLNAQYRSMAAVNGITPAFLNLAGLNQVRATFNLPPIVVYDVSVRVNGVATKVIPTDRFIYLPPAGEPLGATLSGTTAEAIELAGARQISNDQVSGMTAVVEKTFDPVATWTKVSAVALPVLVNPNLTFVADVQ